VPSDELISVTGGAALAGSYVGLLVGLLIGTHLPRALVRQRHRLLAVHRWLNLTVIALMVAHLSVFAIGSGGSWLVALVPGTSGVTSFAFTLGVLSLYGAVLLGPSYYVRRRLGPRLWLVAHQFAALVYALGLWHALELGPHLRASGPWRVSLWVLQLPLLALFALRLWQPRRPADRMDARLRNPRYRLPRYAILRMAATSGIVGAVLVVLYVALSAASPGLTAGGG